MSKVKSVKVGLLQLVGKRITLFCCRYIYTGTLSEITESCVLLTDPAIVYETGAFDRSDWADAQKLPHDWYVHLQSVESFGELK